MVSYMELEDLVKLHDVMNSLNVYTRIRIVSQGIERLTHVCEELGQADIIKDVQIALEELDYQYLQMARKIILETENRNKCQ